MKKITSILIVSLLSLFAAFAQKPFKHSFSGLATIIFPDTPQEKKAQTETVYMTTYKQSVYLASSSSLNMGLKNMFKENGIDGIYESFITGVLNSTKGELLYKNKISIDGLEGIEFGFQATTNGNIYYNYHRVVYLNNTLINYSYLSLTRVEKNDENITNFFDTFKLSINKNDVRQTGGSEFGYLLGTIAGYLVTIGIIVGIGFGIAYIIRKIKYKNNHELS
jgi:hypothetical protein